ncbi:hypothetical protein AGLY_006024 [Aphis glycines]|uniref:Uncharacterized protein n=1 Tax=Aphis glycines TaxID=307491 RepID=A0A6G0TUW1_APHGL|nr:hypothetical protein AGLY_006024 [Aphis glycines]
MRTVLSLCVIISTALACPIKKPSCSDVPKICPSDWDIKEFESQYATLAFQGTWRVQMTTPFMVPGSEPLKTGLFCSCYPSTLNELIFTDTTPCDDTDYNIEYEVIDQSFNIFTQTLEQTKTLFSPAYGKSSKYAIFNVGTEQYYKTPITEINPFVDEKLIRHKIEGFCKREYTVAVIGADKCWEEYMVLVVINQYENLFCKNDYLIFVLTRAVVPEWSTYSKAFDDIQRSNLNPYHLMSVDQSYDSFASSLSPTGSLIPTGSIIPTSSSIPSISSETSIPKVPSIPSVSGDIDSAIQQTSTTTQSVTKSVNVGNSCSSSTTSTTTVQTSSVIISISPDFTSPYDIGPCDLYKRYNGGLIYKGLDFGTVRDALSGTYYLSQCTPVSLGDSPDARIGMINSGFPACSLQITIDDSCMDDWNVNTPYMFVERGMNMRTGSIEETRGYLMSVYPADHEFSSTVFTLFYEGYYPNQDDDLFDFPLDGMICKRPYDFYTDTTPIILCYTRDQIPSQSIMNKITQEILRCGFNPNVLVRFDQTHKIDSNYVFDSSLYESPVTSFSSSKSLDSTLKSSPLLDLPKICPPSWTVKTFDDQCSTIAFQGTWRVQMTTPFMVPGSEPLKTGLFCSSFPSTLNELIFTDTTPCDDTDFNIEYEVIDQSFNVHTQTLEQTKTLFSPAYGKSSKYAIFNVGTEQYYKTPITEINPFVDEKLIRHKIEGSCKREYTVAVIGADECWKEYMVLAVINQYENLFCGNDYIIWVLTRAVVPEWSTYSKAFDDIEKSGLSVNYLMSVDQSYDSFASSLSPTGSLIPTGSIIPTSSSIPSISSETSIPKVPSIPSVSGDIDSVIQQASTTTQSVTKSVNIGNSCSSSTTSTTTVQTSSVIIDLSPDFTSPYSLAPCSLYKGIQIYKSMDLASVRDALSGTYYMIQGSPCSFDQSQDARVGMLNTGIPACSLQITIDDSCMDDWDVNTPYMFVDRGMNMRTGSIQDTRGYLMSAYPPDHEFSTTIFTLFSEGYYSHSIKESTPLNLDEMTCKPPFEIYQYQVVLSIVGYSKGEYLILCIANQFNNPFFNCGDEPSYNLYCYTRDRIPSQSILANINQEILRCGYNPNKLVKIDQTVEIDAGYTFDRSFFESTTSCWSSSSSSSYSMSSSSFSATSSSISIGC